MCANTNRVKQTDICERHKLKIKTDEPLCYPLNAPVTFAATHLVYTGTVIKGMWVTGIVHETSDIAGGV